METLVLIALHQPVTRAEIEDIRGVALAQTTMDLLLESGLVKPWGRKEAPGRPTLWVTTPRFLSQFGLRSLRDLPGAHLTRSHAGETPSAEPALPAPELLALPADSSPEPPV
jgi:segregation and condensation protein B